MDPYENQLLGSFLFALGYEGGLRKAELMPANLFQQTPFDRALSDLVVGSDVCLALEFKRTLHEVSSERRKWTAEAINLFEEDGELLRISRLGHLLVYGRKNLDEVDLRVCRYTDALGIGDINLDCGPAQGLIALLYRSSAVPSFRPGIPPDQLLAYLRRLAVLKGSSEGGRATEKGAWLAVVHKNDRFFYLVAESLEQLLEPRRDMSRGQHHDQERDFEQEQPLTKGRGRGLSR